MVSATHRNAIVKVDLQAIAANIQAEIAHLPAGTELFAVVKANAYGHGAVEVAQVALENGAVGFCVALFDEALELRNAGITAPILVLGITHPKFIPVAIRNDISLTVGSLEWLVEAERIMNVKKIELPLKIHLGIDSGMSRIGFVETAEFIAANGFLEDNPNFVVEGLFTHFASADSGDADYFDEQVARFKHFRELLSVPVKYVHVANTATSLFHEATDSDLVRFGIGLYGLNPSSAPQTTDLETPFPLHPALSLESELVFVKKVPAGRGVSYGSTYQTEEDAWIGTVPMGYADGWQRGMQGFQVKVGETYCPIVGRVCMDQFMVLLPTEMPVGTKVELISQDPTAPNSIKAVADYLGTIHYEVACLLSERLPRIYHQ